ncbi:hypothetical protein HYALB_00011514 [Hymenoscyphus albidus]|uniref:Uncharacterized protein n=1 Tax=Hymenoscyphus albidus TaxID=595503 RepID=A0A9N9LJX1_9HELO|nr:hypothetical protein HYALB_00010360 [Hymenoscyphus albidus]CAG8978753.1 hypothetical protein HYALB_00011514 [Hymenoscyphus albidus]
MPPDRHNDRNSRLLGDAIEKTGRRNMAPCSRCEKNDRPCVAPRDKNIPDVLNVLVKARLAMFDNFGVGVA